MCLNIGKEIYSLCGKLFPICRSITGDGVRKTLAIIDAYIAGTGYKLHVTEIPSGTQVFDWTVPKEWKIRDAYIEDESGNKIIEFNNNNLHVMGYCAPIDKWVDLSELGGYCFTQPDEPDWVPYVTSYYKERSGFCMSKKQMQSLKPGRYHLYCDSELFDGSLTYADLVIPGESDTEILISSYICHPSMANNECSGPALLAALICYVAGLGYRRYTYRFVLNPETIGSIAYLSKNVNYLKKHLAAGIVLSCVGDDRDYSIVHSKEGNTLADRTLQNVLKGRGAYTDYSFLSRGSDERQYNAPKIGLPVVGFCRSKYGMYKEYHTSADNMDLVSPQGFQGAYDVMTDWIQVVEHNVCFHVTVQCEPQLGKRNLYPTISQKGSYDEVKAMTDFIAYCDGTRDIVGISEVIKVPAKELLCVVEKLLEQGLIEEVAG